MKSPTTSQEDEIDKMLNTKPDLVPPPDGLWESIHGTWTGLWTDFHGNWDERQASDVFPISDLLSDERAAWLKEQIQQLIATATNRARIDELVALKTANGHHEGDWMESIKYRIQQLSKRENMNKDLVKWIHKWLPELNEAQVKMLLAKFEEIARS